MSTRLISILGAVWLLLAGLPAAAQASTADERVAAVELLLAGDRSPDGESPPVAPAPPDAPGERDSLVDLPELFDVWRAPARPGAARTNLPFPRLAAPPAPYLEGLRRPPRSSLRPA
jgi:hypothetical protein